MAACPRCGEENPEAARFCAACGGALTPKPGAGLEVRKTVTILFCDVTGSTSLGERQDPEQVRRVMSRYYEEARTVLERHEGTVEKFMGDAVMAVFGIPVLHEDDALRALRAAAELRDAIERLNVELEQVFGVRIAVRIGVNSGEVIAGDTRRGYSFAAGDAVNVSQRLEAAAPAGEILIGESTYRLARDAVRAEPLEPLAVKGKAAPVAAYRLLEVLPGVLSHARRFDSPMVGRDREFALLENAFQRAVSERACHLFTVLGTAGVGKSRLVSEALRKIGTRATVLTGACLPYGEGITFWPALEVVKRGAGITDDDSPRQAMTKIEDALSDEDAGVLAAERVAELVGLAVGGTPATEGFWGFRKLLEALARRQPLVVVFDDLNWAEPTLLDLVEHVADWSRDAPILLVAMARPDLLDIRPEWSGGKRNATTIFLEPLSEGESETLLENLLGGAVVGDEVLSRIHESAEGNPLFVEEMMSMLIDDGLLQRDNGRWQVAGDLSTVSVPPTIKILLASRLDQLGVEERQVIERAALEGTIFHRGSVRTIADLPEKQADDCLMALVRKELISPDRASFAGEDAFRFRHVLIREAAYDALPKQIRAELHERFAAWLEDVAGERVAEYEELVGYHLEQAFRYRAGLARVEERARAAAARGGARLASAGRRALGRGDVPASLNLLERAVSLLDEAGALPIDVRIDLGTALSDRGELVEAERVFGAAIDAAEREGDRVLAQSARLEHTAVRLRLDPDFGLDDALALAGEAIAILEEAGDEQGLAKAGLLVADVHWARCRLADAEEVLQRALVHAEHAGDQRSVGSILGGLCRVALLGPTPVEEGIRRCRGTLERAHEDLRLQATAQDVLAVLVASRGQFDEARDLYHRSQRIHEELGFSIARSGSMYVALVELLAGQPAAAERGLRRDCEELARIGEKSQLSTTAALLARALWEQGRPEEVEHFTVVSEQAASPEDIASQVWWRGTRARALAQRGEAERAESLAREAVALADQTDFVDLRGGALVDLAEALRASDRLDAAEESLRQAIALYERKGNIVSAKRTRAELERLAGLDVRRRTR
jgi:class 3 adenylate cyclase/tetratricopeptide (TPR) repeat protein